MKQGKQLESIRAALDSALAQEDWDAVNREFRKLAASLVNAVSEGDEERIAFLHMLFDEVYGDLTLARDDMPGGFDATAMLWKSHSYRDVAQIARTARPTLSAEARERRQRDARTRILALLQEGNRRPRSNLEIADETGLHVATVARNLVQLRQEGAVRSWPEGQKMMNCFAGDPVTNANAAQLPTDEDITARVERKGPINKFHFNPLQNERERPVGHRLSLPELERSRSRLRVDVELFEKPVSEAMS